MVANSIDKLIKDRKQEIFSLLLFLFTFNLHAIIKRFGYIYHYLTNKIVHPIPEFLCNPSQIDDCIA